MTSDTDRREAFEKLFATSSDGTRERSTGLNRRRITDIASLSLNRVELFAAVVACV